MECPRLYQFQGRRGRGKGYHKNGCAANPHSLQGQQQLFVQLPLLDIPEPSEQPRGEEIACNFLLCGARAACSMVRAEEGAVRGRSSHRQSDLPYLDGAALPCGVPVPALPDGSHAGGG